MTQTQVAAPGRRMRAADRREQLLRVAARMLSDPATSSASMDDIAAAAGVTKPVLYRHFPSKRALVQQVLGDGIERLRKTLSEAVADASTPREQVELGFVAFFRFIEAEPGSHDLLFSGNVWTQSGFAQELADFKTSVAEGVSPMIDVPGIDGTLRRFFGAAIVGMCDQAARQWVQDGCVPSAEEAAADLTELAWSGLRGLAPRT
ncbi:MAG: TetR/AcrR family transcriptional regulator [Acidimicrobiales bacterium]|nr:TetR/AcrR family transcriptional regulator [Acidimicrobiales bacterium]